MAKMKIATRIWLSMIIIASLVALTLAAIAFYTNRLAESFEALEEELEEMHLVSEISFSLSRVVMPANDYLILGGDPDEKENFTKLAKETEEKFNRLEPHALNRPDEKAIFETAKKNYLNLKEKAEKLFAIPQEETYGSKEGGQLMEEIDALGDAAINEIIKWHHVVDKEIAEAEKEFASNQKKMMLVGLLLLLLALSSAFVLGKRGLAFYYAERETSKLQLEKAYATLKAIRDINGFMVKEKDKDVLLQSVCETIASVAKHCATIGLLDNEKKIVALYQAGHHRLSPEELSAIYSDAYINEVASKGILFIKDVTEAPYKQCARDEGAHGGIALMLKHDETTYGIITIHLPSERIDDKEELLLLKEMAGDISFALYNLEQEKKIRESNALRNKFIQIVSHQLRTPLNSIRWNLEALLANELGKLKKEQKEFIRVTYEADIEVIQRIRDLLIAMDIEEGRVALSKQEISLESLWGSVMSAWKKKCAVKNIICEYRPPERPLPSAEVDAEKIREVFGKLTENAVTYTPDKGEIIATLKKTDGSVRFEIADTGIGIPKAEQPKIFTRFYRATNAPTMKPDASGLGLAISKYFVEQHGGRIGFESKEGKGSTFWFEIPLKG